MICWDMKGKRHFWFYHVRQKNLGCQDDFFAFFAFNIQVSSSLGDFTAIHSTASSQDLENLRMTTSKSEDCIAILLTQVFFSVSLCYLQKLISGEDKKVKDLVHLSLTCLRTSSQGPALKLKLLFLSFPGTLENRA